MIRKQLCEVTRSAFRLILGILPVVFWCCLIYSFDERLGAGITILAMVIHELGHLICIFLMNGRLEAPKSAFNGLRIMGQQYFSYPEQMLQYASGPLFNFIAAAIMPLCAGLNEYSETFIAINLATAVSNLLPIDGYDGYRLAHTAICYLGLGFKAHIILEVVSFFFTATLCIFSLFLVYTFGNGYWFMAIFLFATVSKLQKWHNYQNSRK